MTSAMSLDLSYGRISCLHVRIYDLTPEFEANIRAEFIDNIKRLRHHASLGLWCGNNEMEEFVYAKNSWLTKPQEVRDYYLMYERSFRRS